MSLVITTLILTLLGAVAVVGIFAVVMALTTIVDQVRSSNSKSVAVADGSVDVYFRKTKAKVKADSVKVKQQVVKKGLHDLPSGYHFLGELKINLPSSINYKGESIVGGEIRNLVIGPRRLYVMETANGNKQNLAEIAKQADKNARLVSSFLSQKLKKNFRVCGWVVDKQADPNTKYCAKVVREDELQPALTKFERYSQGKKVLKASDHIPEIISELKLAAWADQTHH